MQKNTIFRAQLRHKILTFITFALILDNLKEKSKTFFNFINNLTAKFETIY